MVQFFLSYLVLPFLCIGVVVVGVVVVAAAVVVGVVIVVSTIEGSRCQNKLYVVTKTGANNSGVAQHTIKKHIMRINNGNITSHAFVRCLNPFETPRWKPKHR